MPLAIHCPEPHAYSLNERGPWCSTQAKVPPIVYIGREGIDQEPFEQGTVVTCKTCCRLLHEHAQFYATLRELGITVAPEGGDTFQLWDTGPVRSTRKRKKDKRQLDFGDLFGGGDE